jgi:hypothetical protein
MSIVTLNNRALKDATAVGTITGLGDLVFISRSTASSSSSVSITSGINSTYKEYIFVFNNIHPATDNANLQFNMSIDGGSNYNVTKTSTHFRAFHTESGSSTGLGYRTGDDLAQGTGYQTLVLEGGNDNDANSVGILHLFDPSSTTFVKHFIFTGMTDASGDTARPTYVAGYGNTTSAINAVDFKMHSGNIDSGTIDLYGVN